MSATASDAEGPRRGAPPPGGLRCPADWERSYVDGHMPWDLGEAPPSLLGVIADLGDPADGAATARRVFVPGAGRGHDPRAFARAGFDVTANDIAPSAVAAGRALDAAEGLAMDWLEADLFALPARLDGTFDLVWEQTCFCAIPPDRRDDYVEAVARLLRPGGTWVGVLWDVGRPGGPPYPITRAEVERHFLEAFALVSIEDVPAWSDHRYDEILVRLRRR